MLSTTAPVIPPFGTLVKNVWFWVAVGAIVLLLWNAYANGKIKGMKECK